MNPYWGKGIVSFIAVFFDRLTRFFMGQLSLSDLASDELQIAVLVCLALSTTLVGGFLLLNRMAMLANSLSHTILLGIILSALLLPSGVFLSTGSLDLTSLLFASLIAALLTLLLTEGFHRILRIQREASVGIVFSALFALGIVLATVFTRSAHLGLETVMGSVDVLSFEDLRLVFFVALSNMFVIALFHRPFLLVSFDRGFARSQGVSPRLFSLVMMMQISITAVSAFRAVGVLLVLAFFTVPFSIARLYSDRISRVFSIALATAAGTSFIGVALSRHILSVYEVPLSTGGLVVSLLSFFYLFSLLFSRKKGVVSCILRRRFSSVELPDPVEREEIAN